MSREYQTPGECFREGMTVIELLKKFPDEDCTKKRVKELRWPEGEKDCPQCCYLL